MIKIICVGDLKEKFFKEAEKEYLKRLKKYTKIEIIEIKEEKIDGIESIYKEEERIMKKIDRDYLIVLDKKGKEFSSEEFADKLENILATINKDIVFLIGSSYGISENIKKEADLKISFSEFTFPHQLFRIIFLEQLYRGFKIMNNEKYHK